MENNGVLSSLIDLLKQTPKIFAGLLLPGIVVIFAPDWLIEKFGITQLRKEYVGYVGVGTLITAGLLVSHAAAFGYKWILTYVGWWRAMSYLTSEEKRALKPYIVDDRATLGFDIGDGIANGLVAKGILYRPSSVGTRFNSFDFNMQPWARKYLKRRPRFFK
jgi:hypothetical protein